MNFGIKWECDLEKTNTSNFSIQKQGAPTRTHPAKDHRQERYVQQGVPHQRELPVFHFLQDEPVLPAMWQTPAGLPRCSNRQGWPGRTPVPDGR